MKYNPITRPLKALRLAGLAGIVALSVGCGRSDAPNTAQNHSDKQERKQEYLENSLWLNKNREVYDALKEKNEKSDRKLEKALSEFNYSAGSEREN